MPSNASCIGPHCLLPPHGTFPCTGCLEDLELLCSNRDTRERGEEVMGRGSKGGGEEAESKVGGRKADGRREGRVQIMY